MPRRDDFNEEAMEEKIRKNLDRGFTLVTILENLLAEQKKCFEGIATLEARAAELADQIDYMKEKRGGCYDIRS